MQNVIENSNAINWFEIPVVDTHGRKNSMKQFSI